MCKTITVIFQDVLELLCDNITKCADFDPQGSRAQIHPHHRNKEIQTNSRFRNNFKINPTKNINYSSYTDIIVLKCNYMTIFSIAQTNAICKIYTSTQKKYMFM